MQKNYFPTAFVLKVAPCLKQFVLASVLLNSYYKIYASYKINIKEYATCYYSKSYFKNISSGKRNLESFLIVGLIDSTKCINSFKYTLNILDLVEHE